MSSSLKTDLSPFATRHLNFSGGGVRISTSRHAAFCVPMLTLNLQLLAISVSSYLLQVPRSTRPGQPVSPLALPSL